LGLRLRTRPGRRRTGSLSDAAKGTPVNALDLSRWQFGITTVYHFIFVPLTIGLSIVVAVMQTYLLSLISTLNPHGTVQGIDNVEAPTRAGSGRAATSR
jgi:Cytochrome bd terminal oxidase subunit I